MNNIKKIDLSIVLPCLNEENAINPCLDSIKNIIKNNISLSTEIIIVNNNSTDNSKSIIQEYQKNNPSFNLVLTEEKIRGYGSAYKKGFSVAKGKYIFMADIDGTYDFNEIPLFIAKLNANYDFVVGNRFSRNKKNKYNTLGSMPWHHRYIGNPFLSMLVRIFFGVKIKDIHCGARAIKRKSLEKLSLVTNGMEFASEMIIKASKAHLSITEIPIKYNKRIGTSKLQSLRDGWRHMRFIFIYSPIILFFIPGLFLLIIGLLSMTVLYVSNPSYFKITFYFHPMFFSAGCITTGYQLIYFAFFAKIYSITHMEEKNTFFEKLFKYITLERTCVVGIFLLTCGISIYGYILHNWIFSNFDSLNEIKNSIVALTLLIVGIQTISSAFMLSIVSIKK